MAGYQAGKTMTPKAEFKKNEYRIYKPLFINEKTLKTDIDRELESISQALIWVTTKIKELESK